MAGSGGADCSCAGAAPQKPQVVRDDHLVQALGQFWPKGQLVPPSMPWLGAVVSRAGLYYWLSGFPDVISKLQSGGFAVWADFYAWSFSDDPAAVEARKKRCKRLRDSDVGTNLEKCESPVFDTDAGAVAWALANCPNGYGTFAVVLSEDTLGFCARCLDGVGGSVDSLPTTDTAEGN